MVSFNNITTRLFLWIVFSSTWAPAQDLGTWNVWNARIPLGKKFTLQAEGQVRSLGFFRSFHYFEYKTWGQFQLREGLALGLGAGRYQTHPEGGNFLLPASVREFRIWPQLLLHQTLSPFSIEQRYRAEFRFANIGFRNRFRYRVALLLPFGTPKNGLRPYFASISNELFFSNRAPYFERNRLHMAFHWRSTKAVTWQLGTVHQFDYRIADETGRTFFQVGLFYTFNKINFESSEPTAPAEND
jgi:hypothetical protein